MIISPVVEVYRGSTELGHEYVVRHESCKVLDNVPQLQHLSKRYPNIRNVYYGWNDGTHTNVHKPSFAIDDSLAVLCDVWKHINQLDKGVYLIAARSVRVLNIYHKRWLNKKNKWKLLEAGMLADGHAFIVIKK